MNNKFLNKITQKDLEDFIEILEIFHFEFDKSKFKDIVSNTFSYLNGNKDKRNELRIMQDLENSWYNSLELNNPDYTVYDNIYYLADVWVCWKKYSRQYIKCLINNKVLLKEETTIKEYIGNIDTVVDLGCGIGYTTAALKEVFGCQLFGTNLKNTKQYQICEKISEIENFKLVENLEDIPKNIDLVFASEYFEHFEKPVEHLIEVISNLKPKHIVFANTFTAKSIGHFNIYKHNNLKYSGKEISRLFSRTLKQNGYLKVPTNCFNARPNIYTHE